MKCINCEKEIVDNSQFCSFCGKPTSMVPDYNVYDDDDIHALLEEAKKKEEERKLAEQKRLAAEQKKEELKRAKELEEKKKKKLRLTISIVAVVCVLLVVLGVFAKITIDNNNASSFNHQIKKAETAVKNVDYDTAIFHYKRAIQIEPGNLSARLALVDLYFEMEKDDRGEALLLETIENDKSAYDAYKELLQYYEKQKDTDAILQVLSGVTDTRVKNLFRNYIVEKPSIRPASGTYHDTVRIYISAKMDSTIYYTLDGSNPVTKGARYSSAILLDKKGTYTLKAVAKNEHGIYSDVVTSKFVLELNAPNAPVVSILETGQITEGGSFDKETYLHILVPSGCNAYYTWDNTDPDAENGTLYTDSVMVPVGDHIFSVIIIDEENQQESVIFRGRFEYHPKDGDVTTDDVTTEDVTTDDAITEDTTQL